MVSLAFAARLWGDGLVGRGMAELPEELEGVGRSRIFDGPLGDDLELASGVAADDGDLDDEAFLEEDGELAMRERELAGHGRSSELGQAVEVAGLEGGEVLLHHVLVAEGGEAGGEAGAAGFDGSFDVAGAGAAVGADGGFAGRECLAQGRGGVLAGLDRGGAALGALFRGQGLALGPAALAFAPLLCPLRHLLTALLFREQVDSMSARPQIADTSERGGKRMNSREIKASGERQMCEVEPFTLEEWTSFLVSVRGRTEGTAQRYRRLVERLLEDVGKPFTELEREDIERHLRRLHLAGRGESVREGVVVAVRSLGEWCLARGIVEANPGAALSGPRPYRREVKVLTVAEVSRLLWGDSPGTLPRDPLQMRDRVLLGVAYVAGLRASEIGPLEVEGVVWQESGQIFSILVRHGKASSRDVRLPLDRLVSRMLSAWLAARKPGRFLWGRPLTRGAVRKILHRRCQEVGIEAAGRRLSPHVLRHSLATHLLARGMDIRQVQLLLRHRSIATTEKYLHADVDRLGAALVRHSPLEGRGRKRAVEVRPAMQMILGELQGLVRPE